MSAVPEGFRIYHYRLYDPVTGIVLPKGGLTVACVMVEGNMYEIGVSACSPVDQFCRKTGREIALERSTFHPSDVPDDMARALFHGVFPSKKWMYEYLLSEWMRRSETRGIGHQVPWCDDTLSIGLAVDWFTRAFNLCRAGKADLGFIRFRYGM
jgi:hypothetical protein